ncbi:VCBS repeat-containing protein [Streptomyces sp. NPDC051211]|uniref:FG-GAP repeat domain-containing protein n=1 Tax=Streptomyces sp. NPDC051211 TaxID=3154643 RepID=UPI00344E98F4
MAVAVVATFATAVPLTAATTVVAVEVPAASAAAAEYVIPARMEADHSWTPVLAASSGYVLKGQTPGSLVWRPYGQTTGTPLVVPSGTTMTEAGPNSLAFVKTATGSAPAAVTFRDMRNGAESVLTLPAGHTFQAVVGDAVLSATVGTGGTLMHWLSLENGQVKDSPITVLPPGGASLVSHSGSGAVLGVGDDYFFVTPAGKVRAARKGLLRGDALIEVGSHQDHDTGETYPDYTVWDTRGSLDAKDGHFTTGTVHGIVGNELIHTRSAVPLKGSASRDLFEGWPNWSHALPGDRIVVVGTARGGSQGIHLVEKGPDGKAVVKTLLDAPQVPRKISGLAMDNGRLFTAHFGTGEEYGLLGQYLMPSTGQPRAATWVPGTWRLDWADPSQCSAAGCLPMAGTGDGGVVFADRNAHFARAGQDYLYPADPSYPSSLQEGTTQVSGRHIAYLKRGQTQPTAEVYDLDARRTFPTIAAPGGTFALSGYWLWREKSAGLLEAVNVRTGAVVRTEKVADCDIKALDAWGTSVYWKCDAKAGVYDTSAKKNVVALPAHRTARLGLGFVAWEKDGVVKSTDLRGTTGTRTIGKLAHAGYAQGWTVDRYSGRIAYRDAGHNVRVVDAGIAAKPNLSAVDRATATVQNRTLDGEWQAAWFLNKPASSWVLTIRSRATGLVVKEFGGSDARGAVRAKWQVGNEQNGLYDWTLTAKPADGQGPELKQTGSVAITTSRPGDRDYLEYDGLGDLVSLDAKGGLSFHAADGNGGFGGAKVTGAGWPTDATFIPAGKLDYDHCNDMFVRLASGELKAYYQWCGRAMTPGPENRQTSLGTGWNAYDALIATGGGKDLLTREKTTGDLYLHRWTGKGFGQRTKVSGGWKAYKQLVGAGDLNGDGQGDLLAVDAANTLWRFDGLADGTFRPRAQVNAAGWANGRVQFIGVGDITADGKADIVSRNAAGELLRNSGDGKGGLLATTKIATGFGGYKGIH